ncbi:MAG TPA: peptidoglycan DD-metalloendopeptidase family protein [Firmicutes bacterium]|nr:peptidoglycan DD-metalloendopeptidase family protein [Bacillota bacterium]
MKKHFLKVVSAALCCAMLITCTQTITPVHASSLDDLQSQYNALQQQSDAIQNQMESTQNQIDAEVQKQDQIAAQAELTQQQIDVLTQKIEAYNTEISAKESEISTLETQISEKEQEITEKRNALEKRTDELMEFLRVMYMHDDVSSLDLILGAESFGDALSTAENIEHMSEYNEQVMKELEQQAQELETAKQELETSKTQLVEARTLLENDRSALEADQTTLNTKQSELENQLEQSKNSQTQLENMLGTLGVSQQEYNNNMAAIEQEIQNIYNQGNDVVVPPSDDSSFLWPVPGNTYVSCSYGWRFGGSDFHTGLDITMGGAYGKPIVASKSGVVKYVGWQPNGYGNYLIIDHGDGYSTLYAHCSSVAVSTGQQVRQGETIAYIGSTGWSTGPHCHFEIRINGQHTNPANYF